MKPATARFAFNATCTVLTVAVMSALAYFLRNMSADFNAGAGFGAMLILGLIVLAHKLDVRLF